METLEEKAFLETCSGSKALPVERRQEIHRAQMRAGLKGVLRFSCIAACFLLSSCATQPRVQKDAECKEESCAMSVFKDPSLSDAQKYFFARRAMERGLDSDLFRQRYGTLASFVGEYEEAERVYPWRGEDDDPVKRGYVTALPAVNVVRALSRSTRAVFINEVHASARTRAAIYTLLRPLREEGYNYLALEGLTTIPADSATACSNAALFDDSLAARGYPVRDTAFYGREPIYAAIIREALRLGFKLVAYETPIDPAETIELREQGLAQNLACVFKADPEAKLLVMAGFGHISEATSATNPEGLMAVRFKALTGIDPLTIDTTTLRHADIKPFVFGESAKTQSPSQGFVLSNATGRLYGTDRYDLVLLTPSFAGRESEVGSWLTLDGVRKRMPVSADHCGHVRPCLVQAFHADENGGIPEDSCVLWKEEEEACPLFLSKGEYNVVYSGEDGKELSRISLSSPMP